MDKKEFLTNIENNLKEILNDRAFDIYKRKLVAKKIDPQFDKFFEQNEIYLWKKVLYLSNNSCILLIEKRDEKLSTEALRVSAEIYENLSIISDKYDKNYCKILSALCYDLSGFQANAYCMLRKIKNSLYSFDGSSQNIDINSDNYILFHIQQILLKNIFSARSKINIKLNSNSGIELFNSTVAAWYENILNGNTNEEVFINQINKTYNYYLDTGNIPVSHLLFLLRTRMILFLKRSIWNNLIYSEEIAKNETWNKYIKLLTYDLYSKNNKKNIDDQISRFELWTSQLRAIEKNILTEEKNFVIQMPTSAGKTFIAEISILNYLIKYPDKKCIYIAPFRALTSEKEIELSQNLSKLGFSISSLSGSYEIDEFQDVMINESDVLIATPEKIDLLLRIKPDFFNNVSFVVVDEGHIVGDISPRASLLEFLIIRLKIKIQSLKILFISAVMPEFNADEYSIWLSQEKENVIRSLTHSNSNADSPQWEPTRKLIGKFEWKRDHGRIEFEGTRFIDEETKEEGGAFIPSIIQRKYKGRRVFPHKASNPKNKDPYKTFDKNETVVLLADKLAEDGETLIFCSQPRNTESVARAFLSFFRFEETHNILNKYPEDTEKESYYYSLKWFGEESDITKCIKRGVGIHFGDMPEQVRNSVEDDYKEGKLKILISTNTIGQGINFPIKNLIFRSTIINTRENEDNETEIEKVKNRDFKNIIGRAGRAMKSTEGRIIFVINSYFDNESYNEYIKEDNLEPALSLVYYALNERLSEKIQQDVFENNLRQLAESFLFDFLMEEIIDEEEIINNIINNSLFRVQIEANNIDVNLIKQPLIKIVKEIEISPEEAKVYSKTGLSLKSNRNFNDFIEKNHENILECLANDDYIEMLKLIFILFDSGEMEEIKINKNSFLSMNKKLSELIDIAISWVEGEEIEVLRKQWLDINKNINNFFLLLSQGFYYRFTWGISSFMTILANHLGIEMKDLPENIKNLSSYIKFGLSDPRACLARAMGIKSREASKYLSNIFGEGNSRQFIFWLANLIDEDINKFELSEYDKNNIIDVSVKLSPKRNYSEQNIKFHVKGIMFESRKDVSLKVKVGETLSMRRDYNNIHDPYAIKLFYGREELGWVPRTLSRKIASDIDIYDKNFQIKILETEDKDTYNEILVELFNQ